jgi:receptor expression-enhancing protein 5/6
MDKVKETLQQNTKILDPYAAMVPVFIDISTKAGVNPGLILAGVGSVGVLILMILQGWTILLTTVTVLYPAVHSIRAIESPSDEDDKIWLTYWMVFGLFTTLETFFGFIFYFVPYWEWIRLAFFIWLLLPNFNGAKVLYEGAIKKILEQNKDLINKWISMTHSAVDSAKSQAME